MSAAQPDDAAVAAGILQAIRNFSPVEHDDATLLGLDLRDELALDSLALVIVLTEVEEALGLDLSKLEADFDEIRTPKDLVALLRRANS